MWIFGPRKPPDVAEMDARQDMKGLIKALGYQKDSFVRRDAARALGVYVDARVVDVQILTLHAGVTVPDAFWQAREEAIEPLIEALGDEEWEVRHAAAVSLGRSGDSRAVASLIAALTDEQSDVRGFAAHGLGQIGDPQALDPLITVLTDEDPGVRAFAAHALGQIRDPRAIEGLTSASRSDERSEVRQAAEQALSKIHHAPVTP